MKNILHKEGGKRGSALLIALLMLGVLMTMTLGISTLVLREIRVTQSIVDANKAYYAAEAGVEQALLQLSRQLPGFEPEGGFPATSTAQGPAVGGSDGGAAGTFLSQHNPTYKFSYSTSNKTDAVPGFPDNQPIFVESTAYTNSSSETVIDGQLSSANNPFALAVTKSQFYKDYPRATYRKLALNETHIIPLFSAGKNPGDPAENVEDFLIEYYLNIKDGSALYGEFAGLKLESFDVLRWKIYGKPLVDSGVQRTESIADFYPGVTNNSPANPVCIGTNANLRTPADEKCIFPSLSKRPPSAEDVARADDLSDVTLWSAARECYQTDAGAGVTGGALIKGTTRGDATGCQMRDFVDNHKENYLILTNMVNPNIVGIANLKDPAQLARADIYYRVLARSKNNVRDGLGGATTDGDGDGFPKLVKDFAEIRSTGEAAGGRVRKNLDVRYKAPGFLPVFNFSLYKTSEKAPE